MPQEEHHNSKSIPFIPNCLSPLIFLFIDSIKVIFIQNPKLFFLIYTFGALPLAVFSISLSSTSRKLKSHIARLEWLFRIVDIWVEAGNVKETSQRYLKRLYRYKVIHVLPILFFSLFTVVATVNIVFSPIRKKSRPTLSAIFTALRVTWARLLTTCVVTLLFGILWGHVTPILITVAGTIPATVVILSVALAVEVYAMMVISMALVVSVAEEKSGFEAVRVGSGLMKGRRVTGWVLSGLILLGTNCIGKEIVGVMDGEDWFGISEGYKWTVEIGLVILLGWVVMWSYVAVTVFYCDCRKRNNAVIRQSDDVELLDYDIES